jgi:hypothetical protein
VGWLLGGKKSKNGKIAGIGKKHARQWIDKMDEICYTGCSYLGTWGQGHE